MEKRYLIGVDVGTTGTKALLFSEDGTLVSHAYRGYPLYTPQVGYSEQDAEDWWIAVKEAVREVCNGKGVGRQVVAIALSTQGGTVVPVDRDGVPLHRAIVWNDARCAVQRKEYCEEVGSEDSIYQLSGWSSGDGLPLLEIRWLKNNRPDLFNKTAMFLTVPDYIAVKLTGKPVVDISNVGINQLADIRKAAYNKKLLSFAGISEEQLPAIVMSGEVIGNLTFAAAQELGLSEDVVLVAGAHDQYAVALGAGAVNSGDILIGSGTCWVVTAIGDREDFASGLSQSIAAVPGRWGSLWSLSTGGVCLDWLRQNIATSADSNAIDYLTLNEEASKRKAAEDDLFFYPFSGVCEKDKTFSKATITGLDLSHDKYHLARAIMEGVVFQIVWMLEAFQAKPAKEGLILAGGAIKSQLWCQLLADISGIPVRIPAVADLACVGAAIMAGVGAGLYETMEDGYRKLSVSEQIIYPNNEAVQRYAPLLEKYKHQAKCLGEAYFITE